MTKYLVVYYSWTGKTAKVAKEIATALSADVEEIRDAKRRSGLFGFVRSAFESSRKKPAAILPAGKNVDDYDIVVLGCPVWAQDVASPMRAYILRERAKFRHVALFCTLGGAGGVATLQKMAALCDRASVADLQVRDSELQSDTWRLLVDEFIRRIRKTAAKPALVVA